MLSEDTKKALQKFGPNLDNWTKINEYLKSSDITDEERLVAINWLVGGICSYCGRVTNFCYCRNDE